MSERNKIVGNLLALSVADVAAQALSLILMMVVARKLGPGMMGIYAFGQTVIGMCDIFVAFGLSSYILRSVGRDPELAPTLLWDATVLKMSIFGLAMLVLLALLPWLADDSLKRDVILIMALTLFFRGNMSTIHTFFRARQISHYEAVIRIGFRLLYTLGGLAVLLTGHGIIALVGLDAAVTALGLAVSAAVFTFKVGRPVFRTSWTRVRQLIRGAWNFFLVNIVQTIFNSFDLIMISMMSGDLFTGYYSSTVRLIGGLDFIPGAFDGAFLPVMSRESRRSPAGFTRILADYYRLLLLLGVGVGVILGAFADPIMLLVFGRDFLPAGPTLAIMAAATALIFANWPLSNAIIALDKERAILKAFAVCAAMNIVLNLFLIPLWHDRGAAAATVVSLICLFVLQCLILGRNLLRSMGVLKLTAKVALTGLLTLCFARVVDYFTGMLLLGLASSAVFYFLAALVTRSLTRQDLSVIWNYLRRRPARLEDENETSAG